MFAVVLTYFVFSVKDKQARLKKKLLSVLLCPTALKLKLNVLVFLVQRRCLHLLWCVPQFYLVFSFCRYRALTFILTFLLYTSFHLSRKPISIVKVTNSQR